MYSYVCTEREQKISIIPLKLWFNSCKCNKFSQCHPIHFLMPGNLFVLSLIHSMVFDCVVCEVCVRCNMEHGTRDRDERRTFCGSDVQIHMDIYIYTCMLSQKGELLMLDANKRFLFLLHIFLVGQGKCFSRKFLIIHRCSCIYDDTVDPVSQSFTVTSIYGDHSNTPTISAAQQSTTTLRQLGMVAITAAAVLPLANRRNFYWIMKW